MRVVCLSVTLARGRGRGSTDCVGLAYDFRCERHAIERKENLDTGWLPWYLLLSGDG